MQTHTHTQMHTHTDIGFAVEHQQDGQGNSQKYSIYFIYVINTPRHSHFENVCQADGKKIPVGVDIDGQMLM